MYMGQKQKEEIPVTIQRRPNHLLRRSYDSASSGKKLHYRAISNGFFPRNCEGTEQLRIPYIFLGKVAFLLLFMIALFLIVLLAFPGKSAAAGHTTGGTYRIVSVQIEEGDSLWSIASEYYTDEFSSIPSYITEIKRINGLTSDILYADNYILVPCYGAE